MRTRQTAAAADPSPFCAVSASPSVQISWYQPSIIFTWIISLLVPEHRGSLPFLQTLEREAEHLQDRAHSINVQNPKITWQVTNICWTFCHTDVQMQLLVFSCEEEPDAWAPKAVNCHIWPYSRASCNISCM